MGPVRRVPNADGVPLLSTDRNLVIAYAAFAEFREKIADPAYAGWFLPFSPQNNESITPRCSFNTRTNRSVCSDLFHTTQPWDGVGMVRNGEMDCGEIPCGAYVFDHRNASLRRWLVDEFLMDSRRGMGNRSAMDGCMFDDAWMAAGP